jgi:hypothetical protein
LQAEIMDLRQESWFMKQVLQMKYYSDYD